MQRRARSGRRGGRAPGIVAAACYLVAAGCLAGAAWLGLDYLGGDGDDPAPTAATGSTTTTALPTTRLPATLPPATTSSADSTGATALSTAAALPPPTAVSGRDGNRRPTIAGPRLLVVAVGSTVTPSGLVVDDAEAGEDGVLLLLLVGVGVDFSIDLEGDAQFTGATGASWLPMVGTIEDLNRSLATLAVTRTERDANILVFVDDAGNGDLDRAEKAEFRIGIRNP